MFVKSICFVIFNIVLAKAYALPVANVLELFADESELSEITEEKLCITPSDFMSEIFQHEIKAKILLQTAEGIYTIEYLNDDIKGVFTVNTKNYITISSECNRKEDDLKAELTEIFKKEAEEEEEEEDTDAQNVEDFDSWFERIVLENEKNDEQIENLELWYKVFSERFETIQRNKKLDQLEAFVEFLKSLSQNKTVDSNEDEDEETGADEEEKTDAVEGKSENLDTLKVLLAESVERIEDKPEQSASEEMDNELADQKIIKEYEIENGSEMEQNGEDVIEFILLENAFSNELEKAVYKMVQDFDADK